jgi:hypothetical protein
MITSEEFAKAFCECLNKCKNDDWMYAILRLTILPWHACRVQAYMMPTERGEIPDLDFYEAIDSPTSAPSGKTDDRVDVNVILRGGEYYVVVGCEALEFYARLDAGWVGFDCSQLPIEWNEELGWHSTHSDIAVFEVNIPGITQPILERSALASYEE